MVAFALIGMQTFASRSLNLLGEGFYLGKVPHYTPKPGELESHCELL